MKQSDHDLLITVSAKLDNLSDEVRGIRDGTVAKIASLEAKLSAFQAAIPNPSQANQEN